MWILPLTNVYMLEGKMSDFLQCTQMYTQKQGRMELFLGGGIQTKNPFLLSVFLRPLQLWVCLLTFYRCSQEKGGGEEGIEYFTCLFDTCEKKEYGEVHTDYSSEEIFFLANKETEKRVPLDVPLNFCDSQALTQSSSGNYCFGLDAALELSIQSTGYNTPQSKEAQMVPHN